MERVTVSVRCLATQFGRDECNGCVHATVVRRVHLKLSEPGPLENGKGNLMKNAMAWVALYCIVLYLFIELFNYFPGIYYLFIRVFAIKIIQPIIPSNLKKAKFIGASL